MGGGGFPRSPFFNLEVSYDRRKSLCSEERLAQLL